MRGVCVHDSTAIGSLAKQVRCMRVDSFYVWVFGYAHRRMGQKDWSNFLYSAFHRTFMHLTPQIDLSCTLPLSRLLFSPSITLRNLVTEASVQYA